MALNLWKTGGGASSYNPLPTPWTVKVSVNIASYVITFNASSNSNATLLLRLDGEQSKDTLVALSPIKKAYSFTLNSGKTQPLWLFDYYSNGDIVIDSINLVQAPLNQLTINGVDGFLSGWTIAPQSTVINDQTLVLNATAINQFNTSPNYSAIPNQTYYPSCIYDSAHVQAILQVYDVNNTRIATPNFNSSYTMPSNASYFNVRIGNTSNLGTYTFQNIMVNLGTHPAPYSKKTGSTMVLPTPSQSLLIDPKDYVANTNGGLTFDGKNITVVNASYNSLINNSFIYNFKPNTNYTFSTNVVSGTYRFQCYRVSDGASIIDSGQLTSPSFTFNTGNYSQFYVKYHGNTGSVYSAPMLVEGSIPSTYSPYKLQMNKKPQRLVPNKNLLQPFGASGVSVNGTVGVSNQILSPTSIQVTTTAWNAYVEWLVPLIAGQQYTLSFVCNLGNRGLDITNPDSTMLVTSTTVSQTGYTFTTTQTGIHKIHLKNVAQTETYILSDVQLEKGSASTSFELYNLVLPPANTGMKFNGNGDYIGYYTNLSPSNLLNYAVEATVNFTGYNGSYRAIFSSLTGTGVGFELNCSGAGLLRMENNTTTGNFRVEAGSFPLGFHTVKMERIGSTVNAYIDGVQVSQASMNYLDGTTNGNSPLSPNTSSAFIGGRGNGIWWNGILYKVTLYSNGVPYFSQDFTNPNNIVGNAILPTAETQNLIPNFEDPRWIFYSNPPVLGKDTIQINGATPTVRCILNVIPNAKYIVSGISNGTGRVRIGINDGSSAYGTYIAQAINNSVGFTMPSNCSQIVVVCDSNSGSGIYNISKPQLYQVSGPQGTIYCSPIPLMKPLKRTLYNKR